MNIVDEYSVAEKIAALQAEMQAIREDTSMHYTEKVDAINDLRDEIREIESNV